MEKTPSLADQFASETPQADRLSEVSEEMDTIRQFLDHLVSQRIHLAQASSESGRLYPISTSTRIDDLLYEYYGIDPVALEQERRALLEQARKHNDTRGVN